MREQLIATLERRGFTYHRRETWEPREVLRTGGLSRTPPPQVIHDVTKDAVHYTAAINLPDGDPGEILGGIDGIRQLLIRSNWDYLRNRTGGGYRSLVTGEWFPGYPLGYSWAYDWMGGIWEINGIEFRPAATSQHNTYTKADLLLTDRADEASQLMLRAVRECRRVRKELGSRAENRPWAHGWFKERLGTGTATSCCGIALKSQINLGFMDITYPEGETMLAFVARPESLAPRIYDTRRGGLSKLQGGETRVIKIPGSEGKTHAKVNLTVTQPDGLGYIIAWGTGMRPLESKINFTQSQTIANEITIPLAVDGTLRLWSPVTTHVILDLVGYYKPI